PPEGRDRGGARVRRRAACARRTDKRLGSAHGGGLHRRRRGREGARHVRAAVEPHPRGGRNARGQALDHPRRDDRRDRHTHRAPQPGSHLDQGDPRADPRTLGARRAARRPPRPRTPRRDGRCRSDRRGHDAPCALRNLGPDGRTAIAQVALPSSLRERGGSSMSGSLTGTRPLLRVTLRHEMRSFAPWIAIAVGLSVSSVLAYPWIFPDETDRAGLAATMGANPAIGMVFGPAFDLMTDEGFNSWRSLALAGFLVALGAILTVSRTTRGQEDSGQAELLASGVMGRASR